MGCGVSSEPIHGAVRAVTVDLKVTSWPSDMDGLQTTYFKPCYHQRRNDIDEKGLVGCDVVVDDLRTSSSSINSEPEGKISDLGPSHKSHDVRMPSYEETRTANFRLRGSLVGFDVADNEYKLSGGKIKGHTYRNYQGRLRKLPVIAVSGHGSLNLVPPFEWSDTDEAGFKSRFKAKPRIMSYPVLSVTHYPQFKEQHPGKGNPVPDDLKAEDCAAATLGPDEAGNTWFDYNPDIQVPPVQLARDVQEQDIAMCAGCPDGVWKVHVTMLTGVGRYLTAAVQDSQLVSGSTGKVGKREFCSGASGSEWQRPVIPYGVTADVDTQLTDGATTLGYHGGKTKEGTTYITPGARIIPLLLQEGVQEDGLPEDPKLAQVLKQFNVVAYLPVFSEHGCSYESLVDSPPDAAALMNLHFKLSKAQMLAKHFKKLSEQKGKMLDERSAEATTSAEQEACAQAGACLEPFLRELGLTEYLKVLVEGEVRTVRALQQVDPDLLMRLGIGHIAATVITNAAKKVRILDVYSQARHTVTGRTTTCK
mmetsp:Transcript_22273/g.26775  ORF Transcript_22273/g.26775 Transcript_22273/m.26775 type:complete len:534 (-) Transcript_22273:311-1912(-)|eukprot:CAMPEP_0197849272 /NCGR_PEP_ID=MMETSP1438-20131217/11443_1 /TAXON_ID=1461541 /ORGANISM="Pterosperma sp., Strain CCMP1384" /LENGTH=533 /DNA_ID=CAMNT_0043461867 /DNA_START=198 /DNA_END=1799 /DNA_ORIENTATION=-